MNLSDKKFYEKNGYLIVKNVFSKTEVTSIKKLLEKHTTDEYNNILNPDRFDFLMAQSYEKLSTTQSIRDKIDYIQSCKDTSTEIRKLLKDRRIVSRIEHLYSNKFVGLSTHMIWKKPNTLFSKQAWSPHQDNSYAKNKNGMLLTINLFLDDMSVNNGGLYNYKGSHKFGLLNSVSNQSYGNANKPGNECVIPTGCEKNNLSANAGDLYIQHGNLVHGSYSNNSENEMRSMYSATYIVEGEEFEAGYNAMRKVIKLENN